MRNAIGIVLVLAGCSGSSSDQRPDPTPTGGSATVTDPINFELVATAVDHHAVAGRAVLINVALINRSTSDIAVNRRMLVNFAGSPGELALDVTPDGGTPLGFQALVNAGEPGREHLGALGPGERVVARVDLADRFGLTAPGKYTVVAHYTNTDRRVWTGALTSPPLVIDVIAPGPIGDVEMLADRTLKVLYRHPWSAKDIAPTEREHARFLAHVGAMSPGDKKLVPPWPDDIDDSRVASVVEDHIRRSRQWLADEWTHEITGTDKDGNVMVTVTFIADNAKKPVPGNNGSKGFALVIDRPAYSVLRELAFQ